MKPEIHIGPAGWSYPDWAGVVYPRAHGSRFDPLAFLIRFFDLIEINSTFYRIPTPRVCRNWVTRSQGRADFCFTAKVHRDFTHGDTPARDSEVDEFKIALDPILEADRLGALLVQFPWSFRMTDTTRRYVRDLSARLRPFPCTVEVRHGSWGTPAGRRFFHDNGIPMCGIDQPLIGDSLGPEVYEPGQSQVYFRLHGRNRRTWFNPKAGRDDRYDYLYSAEELSGWRQRIESVPAGVERLFVVLNNHFRGQAVANALQLRAMLSGHRQESPPELIETYPQLRESLVPAQPPRDRGRKRQSETAQMNLFGEDDGQRRQRRQERRRHKKRHDRDPDRKP